VVDARSQCGEIAPSVPSRLSQVWRRCTPFQARDLSFSLEAVHKIFKFNSLINSVKTSAAKALRSPFVTT
jgi:hypothetical protein